MAFCLHFHLLELLHQTEDLFVLPRDTDAGVPRGIRFGVIDLLQIKVEVTEPLFYRFPPLRQVCGDNDYTLHVYIGNELVVRLEFIILPCRCYQGIARPEVDPE